MVIIGSCFGRVTGQVLSQITNDFLLDRRHITAAIFNEILVTGDVCSLIGSVVARPGGSDLINLGALGVVRPLEVGSARLHRRDLRINALVGWLGRPIYRLLRD